MKKKVLIIIGAISIVLFLIIFIYMLHVTNDFANEIIKTENEFKAGSEATREKYIDINNKNIAWKGHPAISLSGQYKLFVNNEINENGELKDDNNPQYYYTLEIEDINSQTTYIDKCRYNALNKIVFIWDSKVDIVWVLYPKEGIFYYTYESDQWKKTKYSQEIKMKIPEDIDRIYQSLLK